MRRPAVRLAAATLAAAVAAGGVTGCVEKDTVKKMVEALGEGPLPDSLPVMRNEESPFRYPPVLYGQRAQGNVTLRLHIDTAGRVRPESTTVAESSGHSALDSAAVAGSRELRFRPAMAKGAPMALSVLFPVHFRHPEAAPLPDDTAARATTADTAARDSSPRDTSRRP